MHEPFVTIIGGTGFIGRYVVAALAKRGAVIQVVSRHPAAAMACKPSGGVGQVRLTVGNVLDAASMARIVRGSDVVVNLVGVLYEKGSQQFTALHAKAAEQLAQAAHAAGVKAFVHMSALGADLPGNTARYAKTKLAGERAVHAAFPQASIVAPSVVFGAEDQFINRFACMIRYLPCVPIIGDGSTQFQPIYVGDVAEALARIIFPSTRDPSPEALRYELGGPRVWTLRELLHYLMQQLGRVRPILPIPPSLATCIGAVSEWLPSPPITRDYVRMMAHPNIVTLGKPRTGYCQDLGIKPTALEAVVPHYLLP